MKFWLFSIGAAVLISCQTRQQTTANHIDNSPLKTTTMEIHYAYTILYVKDVQTTIAFYTKAFGFEQKFLTPEKDYGEIISGPTTIAFANFELGNSNFKKGFKESLLNEKPFGIELAFTTDAVEQVMENAIKHGAVLLEETVTKPWGQQVGYLRDPNGFIIEICTPINSQ